MDMVSDKPTNDALNLCRYCRALLEREPPADLVSDPETLDGVMESYKDPDHRHWRRGVLSTEAVSKTAFRGCLICIQVLGDATSRLTTAIDLVKEPLYDQADQGLIYWRMMSICALREDDSSQYLWGRITYKLRKRRSTPVEVLSSDQPLLLNDVTDDDYDHCDKFPEDLDLFPSGREKEDLINTAPIHDNTASEPTFSNIMGWLDCCLSSHAKCCLNRDNNPGYLPRRVVCLSKSMSARLLLVNNSTPILPYSTLSHSWGTSEKPLRLLASNLAGLQSEIRTENLSRTFLDAFEITWRMGLRYVWIDSLCIIQDNEEDWLVESTAMVNIYSNSYCNMAAAHARNGSEGCFVDRNPNAIKSLTLSMGLPEEWDVPTSYFTIPQWNLDSSPLKKRAWLMSLDPEDHPDDSTPAERGLSAAPGLKVFKLWEEILRYYSECDLTFATDKLVAISGLAKRLQPLTGSRYLAGLWEKHLPYHLLWQSGGYRLLTPSGERYEEYVAPSWSWASIRGQILTLHPRIMYEDEHDVLVKVLEASATLVNENDPFGQVTGGFLQMECYLTNVWSFNRKEDLVWEGCSVGWINIDVTDDPHCPSDTLDVLAKYDSLWLLPIRIFAGEDLIKPATEPMEGLVVEAVDINQMKFRRVGTFSILTTQTSLYTTLSVEKGFKPCDCAWGPRKVITLI
ncbi:Heterokaryon incompatibility protein (HET) domain containing protein [Rhypophila decipiens]